MKKSRPSESGSVIYWIFLGVILFGALGFAVSNISRSGSHSLSEVSRIRAADVMQYSAAIQRAIRLMRINGVADNAICFHTTRWGHNNYDDSGDDDDCGIDDNLVFGPSGGGIGFQKTEEDWYVENKTVPNGNQVWIFSSHYEVEDVGTTSTGSDTESANADILMATAPLKNELCEQLNQLIGYEAGAPPSVTASTYNNLATDLFNDDDVSFSSATGRIGSLGRERCVTEGGGINFYYKVILAR